MTDMGPLFFSDCRFLPTGRPLAEIDSQIMQAAVNLAQPGLGDVWPNPSVGALLVQMNGDTPIVVGHGATSSPRGPHAEILALRSAGAAARGATCYVTLEPCAHRGRTGPCSIALIENGIARVVIGVRDPNPRIAGKGIAALKAAGIRVTLGVGARQCAQLHAGHICRMQDARPSVTLKLAVSADGAIGRRGEGQLAITAAPARRHMHLVRARHDAILIGVGTVLSDDPQLDCRIAGLEARSPVRVVLDRQARLPEASRLLANAHERPLWIMVSDRLALEKTDALESRGAQIIRLPPGDGRFAVRAILHALAQRGVTQLMVEGGSATAAGFLDAGLVDFLALYRSARRIGRAAAASGREQAGQGGAGQVQAGQVQAGQGGGDGAIAGAAIGVIPDVRRDRHLVAPAGHHDLHSLIGSGVFCMHHARRIGGDRFALYQKCRILAGLSPAQDWHKDE